MITLKELTDRQRLTGESDANLIAEWFVENNMATEGIEIVSKISLQKAKKDEEKYGKLCGDLQMFGATENIIKSFGIEDGSKLIDAIKNWIICYRLGENFEEIYQQVFNWLKEFIPTKKQPFIFWRDFLKWLNERNVYFKDQKKEKIK